MAKQYVGARYVPKFASPVEWATNTSYEALTIVTFNNASYTSKVPVPPTVGNPANNPQYWALTGNYNAQVEQYRQETETAKNILQDNINSEAATRASADSNLQSQINQIIAPSGEAPSAAEVENARIGVDGVTYDTLGTAIRSQVGELKGDLVELSKSVDASERAEAIYVEIESVPLATFADGAEDMPLKDLKVAIEPVQDLHGYDHPWPAGGGVNKCPEQWEPGMYDVTNGAKKNGNYIRSTTMFPVLPETSYCYVKPSGNETRILFYDSNGDFISAPDLIFTNHTSDVFTTPQGAYFMTTYTAEESYNNDVAINYPSTVTTYSPYSNICPISGFDGLTVTRTGKNVLNLSEWEYESNSGITIGTDNISVINKGYQETLNRYNVLNRSACVFSFHVKTVSLNDSRASFAVYADGNKLRGSGTETTGNILLNSVGTEKDIKLTVPNGTEYISFGGWAWGGEVQISNLQLELGSTATAYEPYQGQTYDITFPTEAGTVYGGSLTIAEDGSGVLTVDRGMVDMGSMVWNYNTTYAFFTSNSISTRKIGVLNVWSDLFKTMGGSWSGTPVQNALWGNGSNTTLYVQIPLIGNVNDFMALVDGHQLMYKLATPVTHTLTASQIRTLLGQNNIWADAGDTSVTYKANTKLYIDKKFTELQALILEN